MPRLRVARALLALGILLAPAWYAVWTLTSRASGAIGNDPVTYTRMAIDLAERGTPARAFPLLDVMREQGLSWAAALPVGYRLVAGREEAAPVFAFGAPLLLATAWRLAGESGLYALTPLLGVAALLVTIVLARLALAALSLPRRSAVILLTALLMATTPKQLALAIVPMSDVPAQLASALSLLLALLAERRADATGRAWLARLIWLASGLALGLAYLIRHSALLMVIPLLWLIWTWPVAQLPDSRWRSLLWLALGAGLMMAPDLVYRSIHLEHLAAVESPESAVWDWAYVLPNALRMVSDLASWRGFGPLVALAVPGVAVMWRWAGRRATVTLLLWLTAFAFFHLPLALTGVFENGLRYLMPAYPPLTLFIAAGCVGVAGRAAPILSGALRWIIAGGIRRRCVRQMESARIASAQSRPGGMSWRAGLRGAIWLALLVFCVGGLAFALRTLVKPPAPWHTYGWIGPTARADLHRLARWLPPDAVIGASDQLLGAISLYTQRDVFRPAAFVALAREFPRFLAAMRQAGRPVYVVGEPACLSDAPADGIRDDEQLPGWLRGYVWQDAGLALRALPFDCAQRVYRIAAPGDQ